MPPKGYKKPEEITVSRTQRELIVALGRCKDYRASIRTIMYKIRQTTGLALMNHVWRQALENEIAAGRVIRVRGMIIELAQKPK